jgi:hypothetical protein
MQIESSLVATSPNKRVFGSTSIQKENDGKESKPARAKLREAGQGSENNSKLLARICHAQVIQRPQTGQDHKIYAILLFLSTSNFYFARIVCYFSKFEMSEIFS